MIISLTRSLNGEFSDTLCYITMVIGILAGVLGMISSFFSNSQNSTCLGILNLFVLLIAIFLRRFALLFVKLYNDKIDTVQHDNIEFIERYSATTSFADKRHVPSPINEPLSINKDKSTDNTFPMSKP